MIIDNCRLSIVSSTLTKHWTAFVKDNKLSQKRYLILLDWICIAVYLTTLFMAKKSLRCVLVDQSIGIEPPCPLHGRAANCGSIINPAYCHCPDGSGTSLAGGFIARPNRSGVLAGLSVYLRFSWCCEGIPQAVCLIFGDLSACPLRG